MTERALHTLTDGELIDLLLELEQIQEQAESVLMERQRTQNTEETSAGW